MTYDRYDDVAMRRSDDDDGDPGEALWVGLGFTAIFWLLVWLAIQLVS